MNDIYLPGSYIQETQQFMGWDCLFLHSVVWLRVRISSCNLNMITDQSNYICTEIMLTTGLIHYIENNFFCIYLLLQLIFFFPLQIAGLGFCRLQSISVLTEEKSLGTSESLKSFLFAVSTMSTYEYYDLILSWVKVWAILLLWNEHVLFSEMS